MRMLQDLARDAQGDRPGAREALGRAVVEAPEPEGYVRLFLDEGTPMVELLGDAEHEALAGAEQATRVSHHDHSSQRGSAAITRIRLCQTVFSTVFAGNTGPCPHTYGS
jgi:hypothetical protein